MHNLIPMLLDAGLVQFGWFPRDGGIAPVQFHFDMLASYPDVLHRAADLLAEALQPAERLLCSPEALPLSVGLALTSGIPLVYSQGSDRDAVHDLVGAYDIGHPTVFVSLIAPCSRDTRLIASARRVGLDVQRAVSLLALKAETDVPTHSLFRLDEMVDTLVEQGRLPKGQADAVHQWLQARPVSE